jgi:hypothetical protein
MAPAILNECAWSLAFFSVSLASAAPCITTNPSCTEWVSLGTARARHHQSTYVHTAEKQNDAYQRLHEEKRLPEVPSKPCQAGAAGGSRQIYSFKARRAQQTARDRTVKKIILKDAELAGNGLLTGVAKRTLMRRSRRRTAADSACHLGPVTQYMLEEIRMKGASIRKAEVINSDAFLPTSSRADPSCLVLDTRTELKGSTNERCPQSSISPE